MASKPAAKKPAAKKAAPKKDTALLALVHELEARLIAMERALEVQLSVKLDRTIG